MRPPMDPVEVSIIIDRVLLGGHHSVCQFPSSITFQPGLIWAQVAPNPAVHSLSRPCPVDVKLDTTDVTRCEPCQIPVIQSENLRSGHPFPGYLSLGRIRTMRNFTLAD